MMRVDKKFTFLEIIVCVWGGGKLQAMVDEKMENFLAMKLRDFDREMKLKRFKVLMFCQANDNFFVEEIQLRKYN